MIIDYAIQYNTIGIVSCLFCKKFHFYNNFQIQIIAIPADIHLKNSNLFLLIFREFFLTRLIILHCNVLQRVL
jgi:hypothetical protein